MALGQCDFLFVPVHVDRSAYALSLRATVH